MASDSMLYLAKPNIRDIEVSENDQNIVWSYYGPSQILKQTNFYEIKTNNRSYFDLEQFELMQGEIDLISYDIPIVPYKV
jgi:hypothetical protein